jgi:hypothetical protein
MGEKIAPIEQQGRKRAQKGSDRDTCKFLSQGFQCTVWRASLTIFPTTLRPASSPISR